MRKAHLGDSYDIIKQSMLCWLGGEWAVHPMFTDEENVTASFKKDYEDLLGAEIVSHERLVETSDRSKYFKAGLRPTNLFLDPDTGLRMKKTRGKKPPSYLFADELVDLVIQRRGFLTVVFDQSLARGKERSQLETKLTFLESKKVFGFAYCSHASFIVLGDSKDRMIQVQKRLVVDSHLPEGRLVYLEKAASAATGRL